MRTSSPEAGGDPPERAVQPAALQQLVRSERTGRDHDALRGEARSPAPRPGAGALGGDAVAVGAGAVPERRDVDDLTLGVHLRAGLLGEVEVVLDERVLGVVRAADHAARALDAAGALRTLAAEVRIGDGHALLAEVHADPGLLVGVPDAEVLAERSQDVVGRVVGGDVGDPEHPLGLVVVGPQRVLPPGVEGGPLRVGVEGGQRPVERVRVAERAAADPGAAGDRHVLEGREPEDPLQAELRQEEVALEIPGGAREVLVSEAPAGLEDADRVALLAQPQRARGAAEPRADDHPVVVEPLGHGASLSRR